MADTNKIAITTYSGDGSTDTFALAWPNTPLSSQDVPYLDQSHINVVVGVAAASTQFLGTDYNISDDGLSVVFEAGSIPPGGEVDNVIITRQTATTDVYVSFTDGAPITGDQFRDAFLQGIYYAQEVKDQI